MLVDLPRFRGILSIWDQAERFDGMLPSCVETFFGSAPGGAIRPSLPAHTPCHFGRQRRRWVCPATGRRVSKLYLPNGTTRSLMRGSGAYQLGYASQRQSPMDRMHDRSRKLDAHGDHCTIALIVSPRCRRSYAVKRLGQFSCRKSSLFHDLHCQGWECVCCPARDQRVIRRAISATGMTWAVESARITSVA